MSTSATRPLSPPSGTVNARLDSQRSSEARVLDQLRQQDPGPGAVELARDSSGWEDLSPKERARLTRLLSAPSNFVSIAARVYLQTFERLDAEALRRTEEVTSQLSVAFVSPLPPEKGDPFTLSEQSPLHRQLHFSDCSVEIFQQPDADPARCYSTDEVSWILSRLPEARRRQIHRVVISSEPFARNADWARQFGKPSFEAGAVFDGGTLTLFPQTSRSPLRLANLWTLTLHELAHDAFRAESFTKAHPDFRQRWRKAMDADGLSVSGYAESSLEEDLAETTALYWAASGTEEGRELARLFSHRIRLLDEL
jgi:hypothetical protein